MKKSKTQSIFFLAIMFLSTSMLYAVPAIPDPVVLTQPNGDELTVMIRGDEYIHWYESLDGYTLLYNGAGYLSYAQLDESGNLQPTDYIATDIEKRNILITSFLNTIEKNLFYSDLQVQVKLKIREMEEEAIHQKGLDQGRAVTGHYKMICAFVQFEEKPMVKSLEEFEALFNEEGYSATGPGSVKDFFREVSYGLFDLTMTICGIYTAPKSSAYYAGNDGHDNAQELARWLAQQVAAEPHIDFTDYDTNNDGIVDGFHIIFAGLGQASGGDKTTIWPHKSSISPVIQNGKRIVDYSCSPELNIGTSKPITTIGVICHEMTHGLGAPDYYDANYEVGGQYTGTGNWDLMAQGNYNGSPQGSRPAHPNMYIKTRLFGWVAEEILNSPRTITNMPNSAENPVAYRINTTTGNEYFLLENRQRIKFDGNVPGSGLLIYHVHSAVNTSCVNCTHPQRLYPVSAGATVKQPTSTPSSYNPINGQRCVWPTSAVGSDPAKTEFTDDSTPAMWAWSKKGTEKPITNITHENGLISFDFMLLGINEEDIVNHNYLTITPNPANEYIDLQFSNADSQIENIDFYNLTGQLIKSILYNVEYKENKIIQRISITDLNKGIYFIKAGNATAKVVIQ
ncbi:MAG: M6 family metalloprotease domain-containing protein [Lentimicrobiaceae bacterium]|nr:M6 family metalloprotease domain-containing protein [Lentimicrobiaceae bacterium]